MMDLYSKEVQRVAKLSGSKAISAWMYGTGHSPLFDACGVKRCAGANVGCLTQLRGGCARTGMLKPTLLQEIVGDETIPNDTDVFFKRQWRRLPIEIRIKILKRFAYWQRRLDCEIIGREKPVAPVQSRKV